MPAEHLAPEFNPALSPVSISTVANARIGPESFVTHGVEELDNSELRKLADDVLNHMKYAVAAVAANPEASMPGGSVEAGFQRAIHAMPVAKQAKMKAVAQPLVAADPALRQRLFGRIGAKDPSALLSDGVERVAQSLDSLPLDLKLLGLPTPQLRLPLSAVRMGANGPQVDLEGIGDFEDVESLSKAVRGQVEAAVRSRVNSAKLSDIWGRSFTPDGVMGRGQDFEEFEEAIPNRFSVDVLKFICVDETNPEWWGSDEYALGGTGIDETGDVNKVGERQIGGGFDDGDQKWLGWNGWQTFNLAEGGGLTCGWPKTYRAIFVLAEKDHGGFESFLSNLYGHVRDQVKAAVEKAVAAGLSGWIGPALATVVGKAVAWVVDKLVGWLISLFGDDIFPAAVSTMTHVHHNARFTVNGQWGSKVSPTYRAHFYGHGGHGLVEYRWRLHN